jgi:hypothetical protein
MRRERRQTGSPRTAEQSKMDSVRLPAAVPPGRFPWDRFAQDVKKPSNRALRRSFGAKLDAVARKG